MFFSSLKTKWNDLIERIKKNRGELLATLGTLIVFGTFVVKEGLHESWQKTADALDSAQYMYSLSVLSSETDRKLSLVISRLKQLSEEEIAPPKHGQVPKHPFAGEQLLDVATVEGEIGELRDSLSNTMILVERLPELHSMDEECEYYRDSVGKAEGELVFLKDVPMANADYFVKNEKDWDYKPRRVDESERPFNPVDPGAKLTMFDARVLADESTFNLLRKDVLAFNKAVLDEATTLRKRDEHRAKITWWVSAALFVLGTLLALYGKLHHLPLGGE